jgi:hypothetical protein
LGERKDLEGIVLEKTINILEKLDPIAEKTSKHIKNTYFKNNACVDWEDLKQEYLIYIFCLLNKKKEKYKNEEKYRGSYFQKVMKNQSFKLANKIKKKECITIGIEENMLDYLSYYYKENENENETSNYIVKFKRNVIKYLHGREKLIFLRILKEIVKRDEDFVNKIKRNGVYLGTKKNVKGGTGVFFGTIQKVKEILETRKKDPKEKDPFVVKLNKALKLEEIIL